MESYYLLSSENLYPSGSLNWDICFFWSCMGSMMWFSWKGFLWKVAIYAPIIAWASPWMLSLDKLCGCWRTSNRLLWLCWDSIKRVCIWRVFSSFSTMVRLFSIFLDWGMLWQWLCTVNATWISWDGSLCIFDGYIFPLICRISIYRFGWANSCNFQFSPNLIWYVNCEILWRAYCCFGNKS